MLFNEQVLSNKRMAPAFSFGIKHSEWAGVPVQAQLDNFCD